ncbi:MAG: hypothetical protein GY804_01355 [Alphaproteobacteria bacterium]|nr:hypothetical protein [Alphaproteobacteria bacterium]
MRKLDEGFGYCDLEERLGAVAVKVSDGNILDEIGKRCGVSDIGTKNPQYGRT